MEHTTDLRIIKTKLAIKNAFFQLMDEKTFDKITVSDITERAMINRGTFYSHYKDKLDLIEQIENDILNEVGSFISMITEDTLTKSYKEHLPLPHLIPLLSYIEAHPRFFMLAVKNNTNTQLIPRIADIYFLQINSIVRLEDDRWTDYRRSIVSSVLSSILYQWIEREMDDSKEDLAEWITQVMFSTLEAFRKNK